MSAGAQAQAEPSQAQALTVGPAWDFFKPKPPQAEPKPRLSGQARARTSLSATPIPSPRAVSGATSDALLMTDSSQPSHVQLRSVTELFARHTKSLYEMLEEETKKMREEPNSERDMATTIHHVAGLIAQLPLKYTAGSSRIFATAKHFVSTFKLEKKNAIEGIEACEAAAKERELPKLPPYKPPTEITRLVDSLLDHVDSLNLTSLIRSIPYLSLEEQRGLSEELQRGYTKVAAQIAGSEEKLKDELRTRMDWWKELNSLVVPPGTNT
ncbi:hypothetical protein H0H93_003923 [Arthromyces matolae]|nr:hypothetical protein H0H93_003923 [Arthromyces matolae]